MTSGIKTVCIIGKGNVAWHYERRFGEKGFVCSTFSSRGEMPEQCHEADLVIIAVKDEAIAEVARKLKPVKGILVHTSGFVGTECLKEAAECYGSLYPLQTLKKEKETDFDTVPLCTYGNTETVKEILRGVASRLSSVHYELSDSQRKTLHLAAVFCNNFPNHLFGIAKSILDKENIPFSTLFPLMDMTVSRAKLFNPFEVQTGPAIRNEQSIMEQHKAKLDKEEKEIYELLSKRIIEYHEKNKK